MKIKRNIRNIFIVIVLIIIVIFSKKYILHYDLIQVYWNKNFPMFYTQENISNFEGRDGIYYDILKYEKDIRKDISKDKLNGISNNTSNNIPLEHEKTIKEISIEDIIKKLSTLNLTDEELQIVKKLSKDITKMKDPIIFGGETLTTKLFIIYDKDNFALHLFKYHE